MEEQDEQTRRSVRALFETTPAEYESAMHRFAQLSRIFHSELARAVEPVINNRLRTLPPQHDVEAKRTLVADLHQALSILRLTIQHPETGRPAYLSSVARDHLDTVGRFRIEDREDGGRRTSVYARSTLPELRLMEQPVKEEPLSRAGRIRRAKQSETGRDGP